MRPAGREFLQSGLRAPNPVSERRLIIPAEFGSQSATAFLTKYITRALTRHKYKIIKEIFADPSRDSILQKIKFINNDDDLYHLYLLVSPHLGNRGAGNTGWIGSYKEKEMLFACRNNTAIAVASSLPWKLRSAGFVNPSDNWHDLKRDKKITTCYERAENGNVYLLGEIDLSNKEDEFLVSTGFGQTWEEAAQRAFASLVNNFDESKKNYIDRWQRWHKKIHFPANNSPNKKNLCLISASVLRIHEAKSFPGGLIASLSIPWGFAKGDNDLGGYHLVWPRDLVEAAGALLSLNAVDDVKRIINYLFSTQEDDGHWAQNMWLDGTQYWNSIQMDETAFPILLVDLARRKHALDKYYLTYLWPMIEKAASFIVCNGPVTMQDRWEEDAGFSPFTLAVEIAALLAAADMAELNNKKDIANYLKEIADAWNSNIEKWTYVKDSDLSKEIGVDGYYVRIAPPEVSDSSSPASGFVNIKNRPPGNDFEDTVHIISPDALALVRFGLRDANDSKILNTIKVIDELLKVETPNGPAWHRYNDDGYGEHEDGSPFDGTGTGRAWPLLTGERAHYEIASGNIETAKSLLSAMENFSNEGGLIPEQIWDGGDIPEKELFFGKPSGSAMPLVWAHAEYLKLCKSIEDKNIFDMPPQTFNRYVKGKKSSSIALWKFNNKLSLG
jgi:glucoamylase